jgi:hypothetical protein
MTPSNPSSNADARSGMNDTAGVAGTSIAEPKPGYPTPEVCNGCGAIEARSEAHGSACGVPEPVGINGLTEAETSATASVFGLTSGVATPDECGWAEAEGLTSGVIVPLEGQRDA